MNGKIVIGVLSAIASSIIYQTRTASACGGFFCNQRPVTQTGEQIIFAVDEVNDTVQVDVQISYQGLAEDFAWLLPLPEAPLAVETGSSLAFLSIERMTAPRFNLRSEERGQCSNQTRWNQPGGRAVDGSAQANQDGGSSVTVLQQSNVGPYASVVLEGTNPQDVRDWLENNDYRVTDEMMEAITPYISKGDVLLALKLQKNVSVGALQPVSLKLPGSELCIPLRLTAIAAQDDMDVTAYVLSNSGRAVPTNYLHFQPNLARIDWVRGAFNYRQLVGDAADEAGGNAFTTEYAGPTTDLPFNIYQEGEYQIPTLAQQTNLSSLLRRIQSVGLNDRTELQGILQSFVSDADLESAGLIPESFWRCPQCFREELSRIPKFNEPEFSALPIVEQIKERIVGPDKRMQESWTQNSYLTRLFTLISPEEMGVDPVFDFRGADSSNVSNRHNATLITTCNDQGNAIRRHIELENGTVIELDAMSSMPSSTLNQMPAALTISDPSTGVILVDNQFQIRELAQQKPLKACNCSTTNGSPNTAFAGLALIAVFGLIRMNRRRQKRR